MNAPTLTYDGLISLSPCADELKRVVRRLGGPEKWNGKQITAAQARDAGISFDSILWAASALARDDKDIDRRLRLWMADCAARVLHIYEKTETSTAPREAIIAARQYARGEIEAAARAARAAARAAEAARDAVRDAAGAAEAAAWAAGDAAEDAAWSAAEDAARDAVRDARNAAWAAGDAAWAAEERWQFDRLIARLSDDEPEDWPLPDRNAERSAA